GSAQNNPWFGSLLKMDFDVTRRKIVNATVKGQCDVAILAGRSNGFEATARNPFTEAVQPAATSALRQFNEFWVKDFIHRRTPSQTKVPDACCPDVKASLWNDSEFQSSVINLDNINPILSSACKLVLFNAPCGLAGRISSISRRQSPFLHRYVIGS